MTNTPSIPSADDTDEALQREYYRQTASGYDAAHVLADDQHVPAMAVLSGSLSQYGMTSVLDVGAGTGRVSLELAKLNPDVRCVGIEPVAALREVGHAKGVPPENLIDGDGTRIPFADGSFDLVCCFAVLHHVREPSVVVGEMLRVARRAILISDANNFGQGGALGRAVKQAINAFGLWPLANYVKTRGRGYSVSDGDGLAYSYSVYNNLPQIERTCSKVFVMNTGGGPSSPYRRSTHVALLGLK